MSWVWEHAGSTLPPKQRLLNLQLFRGSPDLLKPRHPNILSQQFPPFMHVGRAVLHKRLGASQKKVQLNEPSSFMLFSFIHTKTCMRWLSLLKECTLLATSNIILKVAPFFSLCSVTNKPNIHLSAKQMSHIRWVSL